MNKFLMSHKLEFVDLGNNHSAEFWLEIEIEIQKAYSEDGEEIKGDFDLAALDFDIMKAVIRSSMFDYHGMIYQPPKMEGVSALFYLKNDFKKQIEKALDDDMQDILKKVKNEIKENKIAEI